MYFSVPRKLSVSLLITSLITSFVYWLSAGWIDTLNQYFNPILSWTILISLAVLPAAAIALIYSLLLMDKRPQYTIPKELPDVSILIAAYNEEAVITTTLESIVRQDYPGTVFVYIIDDGSTDKTCEVALDWIENTDFDTDKFLFFLPRQEKNKGKAAALNKGLDFVDTKYVMTIDADTILHKNAIAHLVTNIHCGPDNTAAVAGNILVRNSRKNLLTEMQEWEYFLSIAASKRSQSLLQGTLVAQGAISVYNTELVRELGGWNTKCVGEDIVLTWGLQHKGYRIAYSEKAIAFTSVPTTYTKFFRQRERWARGMIEAFKMYPKLIFRWRLTTPFILTNVFLPLVDSAFLFVFVPGLFAALFFQWYEIVSVRELFIIPLIIILSWFMHAQHRKIFEGEGLKIRYNPIGWFFWAFTYMFIMTPATVLGYIKELFSIKKNWGTKK